MAVIVPPSNTGIELVQPSEGGDKNGRPRYRPPIGIPVAKGRELGGKITSLVIHAILIFLAIVPLTSPELVKEILGAGGPGPAGGGGGGNKGSGGGVKIERTQMIQVAPPPKPVVTPQIKPPEVKPIVPPPPVPAPPAPTPVKTDDVKPPTEVAGPPTGTGGGTGTDGSAGTGPGSGGGRGSGVGTGTGSANGPGTGGGPGTVYPPTPTELFLPPMPVPKRVQGKEFIAEFDIDSTGKVIDFAFNQTPDGGYNKKLREVLAQLRFRPAVNGLGLPVRAKFQIVYTF